LREVVSEIEVRVEDLVVLQHGLHQGNEES
jgi:hypothetical protein